MVMLIEVLVALALFGLAAVFLVDGVSVASRTMRLMKDTREMEQDLLWARNQIFKEHRYEKLEDGGEIKALTIGEIRWETEIEMTKVIDLYKITLTMEYEGNDEIGIDQERASVCFFFDLVGQMNLISLLNDPV